jgi:archaellum biogenesis ATPase FlaH
MSVDVLLTDEAQELFINAMVGSPIVFAKVNNLIKAEYFDDRFKSQVSFLISYFREYKALPSQIVFEGSTATKISPVTLEKADTQFISQQIAQFCQMQATIAAVRKAPSFIAEGKLEKMLEEMKKAVSIQLQTDLGLDYFSDPYSRLLQTEAEEQFISTGWTIFDDTIGGGLAREELVLFTANSGVGKSLVKLNLARNLLKQGLNGVYITLEMRNNVVAKRLDSMISNIASKDIFLNKMKVGEQIEAAQQQGFGRFFIKRMREGTTHAGHIAAYLDELKAAYGFVPDFIVVDYLDLMCLLSDRGGTENMFIKDKYVTEEVRALGMDYNSIIISSSQLGRSAVTATREQKAIGQDHIQGGISKINTSDLVVAIIKDDIMDQNNEYRFEILKARNSRATGKKLPMKVNPISLLITEDRVLQNSVNNSFIPKKNLPSKMIDVLPGKKSKNPFLD